VRVSAGFEVVAGGFGAVAGLAVFLRASNLAILAAEALAWRFDSGVDLRDGFGADGVASIAQL
jgi:hypothetical protein